MVIDTHIHPALFAPICEDQERFRRRCDAMNYHLMKMTQQNFMDLKTFMNHVVKMKILKNLCNNHKMNLKNL